MPDDRTGPAPTNLDPAGVGDADYRRWLEQRAVQLEDRLGRMRADRRRQRGFTALQSQAFSRVKGELARTQDLIRVIDETPRRES